ncbi:tumor necrosis factor receptor superfamily member 13C [Porphyrio hochstetteri]
MAASGKAAASISTCHPNCFDPLIRDCIKCSELFKDNTTVSDLTLPASHPTTEPTRVAPTSALAPTLPSVDLPSTLLIFGVPVLVVFILALATLWGFLVCKVRKQRKKRKAADEEAKENVEATSPLPSPGCQDPAALAPAPCPHLNGGLKMPGPPEKAGAKRRPCCQGDAEADIVLLSTVYPRHEECNHGFPLPATELGATALVTTKTTQNCPSEERA